MDESIKIIADVLKTIGDIIYVITHPIVIWNWFIGISYWIATIICSFCILYYAVTGSHKFTRIMWITIITYILLKGVDAAI